jgi:hypothetical protein
VGVPAREAAIDTVVEVEIPAGVRHDNLFGALAVSLLGILLCTALCAAALEISAITLWNWAPRHFPAGAIMWLLLLTSFCFTIATAIFSLERLWSAYRILVYRPGPRTFRATADECTLTFPGLALKFPTHAISRVARDRSTLTFYVSDKPTFSLPINTLDPEQQELLSRLGARTPERDDELFMLTPVVAADSGPGLLTIDLPADRTMNGRIEDALRGHQLGRFARTVHLIPLIATVVLAVALVAGAGLHPQLGTDFDNVRELLPPAALLLAARWVLALLRRQENRSGLPPRPTTIIVTDHEMVEKTATSTVNMTFAAMTLILVTRSDLIFLSETYGIGVPRLSIGRSGEEAVLDMAAAAGVFVGGSR